MRIACILELCGSRVEGGRDIATKQLVKELRKKGAEVRILSYEHGIPGVLPRIFRETPVLRAITAFPISGRKILRELEDKFDIFYLTSTSTAALYKPSTPTLVYCHGSIAHKWEKIDSPFPYSLLFNPLSKAVVALVERRCLENVDTVIAVHRVTLDFIKNRLGASGPEMRVLENGVDTDLFKPAETEGEGVIFVGRATASKGFDVLLEAAPRINANITAVVYKMERKMMDDARGKGIEVINNVPHQEMASRYQGASVFVLPSVDEEHPLTTLEAMACGLPVVASIHAAAGMIKESEGGYIVPVKDPVSLARRTNEILGDRELRKKMGERNRMMVEQKYSWESTAETFLSICRDLTERKRS